MDEPIHSGRVSFSTTYYVNADQVKELERILTAIEEDRNIETMNELRLFAEKHTVKRLELTDSFADTLVKFLVDESGAIERTSKTRANEICIALQCFYLFVTKG